MIKLYFLRLLTVSLFCCCVCSCIGIEFGEERCNGKRYTALNQACEEEVLSNGCENKIYNTETQFCYKNKVIDKCAGMAYEPTIQKCEGDVLLNKCGDKWYDYNSLQYCVNLGVKDKETFTDSRDARVYRYVVIGAQTWMAENLRYETSKFKCYNDNLYNCDFFGMMYDWETALEVCPEGWHLPSDAEWEKLAYFAHDNVSTRLRASSELWIGKNGTDDFGFSALPGGMYRGMIGFTFHQMGEAASFWSSNMGMSTGSAHYHYVANDREEMGLDGLYINNAWLNVRCIKD